MLTWRQQWPMEQTLNLSFLNVFVCDFLILFMALYTLEPEMTTAVTQL